MIRSININFLMKLKVGKSIIQSFFSILFYKITLDLAYYFVISRVWDYSGFVLNLDIFKLFESYLLLFAIFVALPKSSKKLSNIVLWLLILLSYVPVLTLFSLMDYSRIYTYAITGFWLLVFLLLKFPTFFLPFFKKTQSKIIYYLLFFFLSTSTVFLIYKYLGFSLNFDLTKVYEIRYKYIEAGVPFAGYLFTWLAYVVNPVFFAQFIIKRKYFLVILIIILQLFLFSATGLKTFLFALPFVLILMWIINQKNPFIWMAYGLTGIILLGIFSYFLINDLWITSLFVRRTLLVPAQISFFYYDFFSNNGYLFLSQHHIFSNFLDYPYHLKPPHLIGEIYFNDPKMGANNGIYGDAYMNFGFVGFLLWGFLLAMILKLIDIFSKNKDKILLVAIIAIPSISLVNSALLTCLITHGLLLSLIILYLIPKQNEK